jgi:tRNA threonylcarbamoyladenosine biosynthesis protein TsaE
MPRNSTQITTHSPEETCALAQALGPHLAPGDALLLSGEVGAGKTHFARCLIQGLLDQPEDVPSPTFTLVQTYPVAEWELWHADLYRLTDIAEIEELGLLEAFETAVCLVEWPDRLGELTPPGALSLTLEATAGEETRILTFEWTDSAWETRVKELANVKA